MSAPLLARSIRTNSCHPLQLRSSKFTIRSLERNTDRAAYYQSEPDGNLADADTRLINDRKLAEDALRDRQAYSHIIHQYKGVLARYVRRLLGRQTQAVDDVLQDIFIKAYVNLNDYDRTRPFSPWIYRIAHNEAVNHLRKRNTEPQTVAGEDAQLILDRIASSDDPSANWVALRTAAEVQRALSGLDARYRDALVLRFLEDKSYDEISDILQIPPGTVATNISRGLKHLKVPLQDSWDHAAMDTGPANDRP